MKKEKDKYTVKKFQDFLNIVTPHAARKYMYRGQNNYEYKLESSLFRAFSRNKRSRFKEDWDTKKFNSLGYEKEMLETFKRNAHIFLQHFPEESKPFDWLALMQHYGAPTRLLDFSFSPYIALFFAISGATDKDAAVYCIDYEKFKEFSLTKDFTFDKFFENKSKSLKDSTITWFEPSFVNERLFAQQGVFLVPNTLEYSHEEILNETDFKDFLIKIKITPEAFSDIIKELYKMNITASTVYTGFEGFCKSFEHIGIIPIKAMRHLPDLYDQNKDNQSNN